jgi:transposase InsO family protein
LGDPPGSVVAVVDHDGNAFCVETLEDALARHDKPEIFNTDQGSQFIGVLASNAIAVSMDGKGAWRDNVFIERLWRSVKYEEVYLRPYPKRQRGAPLDRPISQFLQWPPTTLEP